MSFPLIPEVLRESVNVLRGVTPGRQDQLARLGIMTVADLLGHFPRSYEDLTDIRPIAQLSANTFQTTQGEVVEIEGKELADGRSIISVVLADGDKCVEGVWFNQPFASRR